MQRGSLRGVHPTIWTMAGIGLVVVLAVVVVSHVRAVRDRHAEAHVQAVARQLSDPVVLTPLMAHRDCNGETVVRCGWTTDPDVENVAAKASVALTRAAHEKAQQECSDVVSRVTVTARSCRVQIVDGGHAVTIFIDPFTRLVGGTLTVAGSSYSVYA